MVGSGLTRSCQLRAVPNLGVDLHEKVAMLFHDENDAMSRIIFVCNTK